MGGNSPGGNSPGGGAILREQFTGGNSPGGNSTRTHLKLSPLFQECCFQTPFSIATNYYFFTCYNSSAILDKSSQLIKARQNNGMYEYIFLQ